MKARTRCCGCGVEQPTTEEWNDTDEGALPELCWGPGSAECREHRAETFARIGAVEP